MLSTLCLTWPHLHDISGAVRLGRKERNISVYQRHVAISWLFLFLFFFLCHVWTLDAFIPHSPAAHTTPSCLSVALSSYQALKTRDGESRGVLFFRGRALLFAAMWDVNSPLRAFMAICWSTQYLSVCVTVTVMAVCVFSSLSHWHRHIFGISTISIFDLSLHKL